MKIMFYIHTLSHGGAERVMVNLAHQFCASGHEVVFVNSCKAEWEYTLDEAVHRVILTDQPIGNFLKRNWFYIKALRRLIKDEKPDVLISFMAEPNFRAVLAAMGTKTKTLVSVRNDPDKEYPNRIFRFLAKTLYKKADGVVFQTEDAQKWFPKKVQQKSRIIFNQVNERFYAVKPADKKEHIVTVGRLTAQKNHPMLIEAFASIADRVDDNLIIYGEGEKREELEQLVRQYGLENRVLLPGTITDVPETVKTAKMFVMSSDYEGMPNALIEAMTLGVACVSTDCPCGGPKILFDHEKNGVLVPVNDADALAEAMLAVLTDDARRQTLGENARKAAEKFNPETIFGEWQGFAEDLAKSNRP